MTIHSRLRFDDVEEAGLSSGPHEAGADPSEGGVP
jgi:hypothetical protein